jgi:predicted dehydrogenase
MSLPLDRRHFLASAAGGAAVLAFGNRARAAQGANDEIRLAIAGVHNRGNQLLKQFLAVPNCRIAYVCDVDERAIPKAMKTISEAKAPEPKVIVDFREALDDKEIDGLIVATPDHWHAPATILACAAGKHVYCEKPASHNGQEGEWMIAAARKHDRLVQIGTQRRSFPTIGEALGRLKEGAIGKVRLARGWSVSTRPKIKLGDPGEPPKELNYDLWQGPAPTSDYRPRMIPYEWHWFWNWGTGELGNNGVHAVDLCRWGLNVDYPTRVTSDGGQFGFNDDKQTPDTQFATFHFGDKMIQWEHRTWNRRGLEGHGFGTTFYGDDGTMYLLNDTCITYDGGGRKTDQVETPRADAKHPLNFCQAIRGEEKLNCDVEEGVKSAALCHLGNIAYRTQRTVHFDAEKQEITGDKEAAALWSREYREGWQPQV